MYACPLLGMQVLEPGSGLASKNNLSTKEVQAQEITIRVRGKTYPIIL
jgi:hypothetical protein